ncbi:crossover junction endonuclease EME1-like [Macrosteles quadrilineatus]|uniref:crossover junction endonuclease EME1-like n=1 Tax=Macrosteles quadrilineatus TaxID=74068 RepID=UPI0023E1984C|nr:crossover junction endonuclease EME1-like [Macrosteles quadrilineatus]
MADFDVISLSSDTSRPSSPFINVSEVFNDSENINNPPCTNVDKNQIDSSPLKNISPFKRILHDLSESDHSDTESNQNIKSVELSRDELDRLLLKYSKNNKCRPNTETLDSESELFKPAFEKLQVNDQLDGERNAGLKPKKTNGKRLEDKEQKQREKEQKRAEKLAAKELQNYTKPGNCLKYMTVVVDSSLVSCPFGGKLIDSVQSSESKCQISAHIIPQTIFWKRELPGLRLEEENYIVVIWDWQTVIPAIKSHTLCSQIQDIQAQHFGKSVYLVFYGLNSYFSYIKSKRRHNTGDNPKRRRKESNENEFPYVTRKEIEEELIELQIMMNCNHRIIESPDDLCQLILQITKAIAETPFKLEKQRRELENLEWFAVGDSRDCVTVDKAGNGLLRLWQQQLCQFNLAGHDVAQAIVSVYPSPRALVLAYDKCNTQKEGEELLRDIHVRRCQGPLTSSRRIGPELSRKIYTFFSSVDGDTPLSQEQL